MWGYGCKGCQKAESEGEMERPILFNTAMVQAILSDKKTQTRRIAKPHIPNRIIKNIWYGKVLGFKGEHWVTSYENDVTNYVDYIKPPCSVGDTLWVRETFTKIDLPDGQTIYGYKTETCWDEKLTKWHPSIHMPRKAARIFLKVTNVKVERLQNITTKDCVQEGFTGIRCKCNGTEYACTDCYNSGWQEPPELEFMQTWDGIYGNWDENPWVWVIEFEKISSQQV